MMRSQKPKLALLTVVAGVMLVGAIVPGRVRTRADGARMAMLSAVRPAVSLFGRGGLAVQGFFQNIGRLWAGADRTKALEQENAALRNRLASLESQLADSERQSHGLLRYSEHLSQHSISPPSVIPARVIGRDPMGTQNSVIIDRGRADGVTPGCGVVWQDSVVGLVMKVAQRCSRVSLVTAPNCRIPALLVRTGEQGLAIGSGGLAGSIQLTRIQREPAHVGEPVVTSGLLGIFPRHFVIGRVNTAAERRSGLFFPVTMEPAADLSTLHSVLVIRLENREMRELLSD